MSLPPNKELLKRFKNKVYVETGIWRGDSIQQALDAGYSRIIGLDNDLEAIRFCESRFDLNHIKTTGIELVYGDSAELLETVMLSVKEPATILLDAHWQLLEGTSGGKNPFPIMAELRQLLRHRVKTHTIIVDDFLYMTHPGITGWSAQGIKDAISDINDDYEFEYVANPIIQNMLVAWVP